MYKMMELANGGQAYNWTKQKLTCKSMHHVQTVGFMYGEEVRDKFSDIRVIRRILILLGIGFMLEKNVQGRFRSVI